MTKDYEVGFGRPPKHTRFKKGQSGNPKGRPKGRKNMATVMKEVLALPVVIKQNGRERRVPFSEAFVHKLAGRSLEGSPRDMIALMKTVHDYMPEALEAGQLPQTIEVLLVDSDGNGRPADRSRWTDSQRKSHAAEVARRNEDPAADAVWKASGVDDEEDEAPAE